MKKLLICNILFYSFTVLPLYCQNCRLFYNDDFKTSLLEYFQYIDSVGFDSDFDFIHIEANCNRDTTIISITRCGGAYIFINQRENIIDFFELNGFYILLIGDFPNPIINIMKNSNLDIVSDILEPRYQIESINNQNNHSLFFPVIYDDKEVELTFKKDSLIKIEQQYF